MNLSPKISKLLSRRPADAIRNERRTSGKLSKTHSSAIQVLGGVKKDSRDPNHLPRTLNFLGLKGYIYIYGFYWGYIRGYNGNSFRIITIIID